MKNSFLEVSAKTHYGVRLMAQLAMNKDDAISLKTISERENISLGYLEEIARDLKKYGLIKSVRGAHGGYRLAKLPSEIMVADILTAIEGPIQLMPCIDEKNGFQCPHADTCLSRKIWSQANDQIKKVFSSMTLGDL